MAGFLVAVFLLLMVTAFSFGLIRALVDRERRRWWMYLIVFVVMLFLLMI
ncbi:hypothetical protein NU09_1091 [Flavobacterium beibuense]|uniref:Uncharacterized protein n=1 Tax=Flavobacterium beibuense TaxID=657326 RepID=A0A444WF47_9FLAO|nr:hypothetical protein NU09_1091 [Flavobacterium beibuense]